MLTLTLVVMVCAWGYSQSSPSGKVVGGGCDGCNLIYEGMPSTLFWETIIPDSKEPGEPLIITGTIYKKDGRTPAPGVILYVYHTDNKGNYSATLTQREGRRHGHLRGWMKTDDKGRYRFRTIRPASYPNRKIPAHIHPIIKEEGINEYYLDEYLFDDDPLLTADERSKQEKRGGLGIIKLIKNQQGEWIGQRNIVLGLNIPNY